MKDLDQRNLGETGVYSYYDSRLQPIRMRGGKGSQWHGLEAFSHSEEQRETNIERSIYYTDGFYSCRVQGMLLWPVFYPSVLALVKRVKTIPSGRSTGMLIRSTPSSWRLSFQEILGFFLKLAIKLNITKTLHQMWSTACLCPAVTPPSPLHIHSFADLQL